MKRKILYIINQLTDVAPITVTYNIIKNLDKTKFEPYIITISPEHFNSAIKKFEDLNIPIFSLNITQIWGYVFIKNKLLEIIKRIKPDVIHVQLFRSTIYSALFLSKYKLITTIHCDYDEDFKFKYGTIKGTIMSFLFDLALMRCNKILCCSKLLSQIINNKKHFKTEYINNGIDIEKFSPIINKSKIRKKLNLPANKKIFIWVGFLTQGKDPLTLVNAIKILDTTDNFYIFCGDGPLMSNMKEQLSRTENVIFLGNIKNIQEYLQASDYYVSTSLSEGLPLSVLEAMSSGLPVILTDILQHKIFFKEKIGRLYQKHNALELAQNIIAINKDDYDLLSNNSRKTVVQYFSDKQMCSKYEDVYES